MFVHPNIADEPPRKRNKMTAADVDAIEKVSFPRFIYHRPLLTNVHSLLWTFLEGRL